MPNEKKDFQQKVEMVLRTSAGRNRRAELRIARWFVDNVDKGPKLEKRMLFIGKDGRAKLGKCMGLDKNDIEFIVDNIEDIRTFFP